MSIDVSRPFHGMVRHIYVDRETEGAQGRYLRVIIYPSTDQLQAAARRYRPDDDYTDTAGIFHPTPLRSRYDRRKRRWTDTTPPYVGTMRLAASHLTLDVIAHECTHAALTLIRHHDWAQTDGDGAADFGTNCSPHEERFAYVLGDLVAAVQDIVTKYQEDQ